MNGSSLNPLRDIAYPTAVLTSLPSGASFSRYDPSGKYIVGARPDGRAFIWDLDTKSLIRRIEGHVKMITSVDWSRNSRYLLTTSKDWNIIIWDLASEMFSPRRHSTIRFDAPVLSAMFHPRNMKIVLVLLAVGEVYIVDSRREHRSRIELLETEDEEEYMHRSPPTCARFDPSGKHVFVGTSHGSILVFNTRTKMLVCRYRISGAGIMKGLSFAKYGRRLITNSSDRTLRQFNLPLSFPSQLEEEEQELEPAYKFSDPISRVAWHNMAYSPDGEWLAGGSADPATHKIYIWDISSDGQYATTLDGGREPLLDVTWHPKVPAIASTTKTGDILLWHCPTPERWGAFAGGFEECDENVEYEEREDEFDIEDEDEMAQRKMREEDADVDINGVDEVLDATEIELRREVKDEDILWAEDEPDDDTKTWKMKLILNPEDDY
ncbi:SWD1 [Sanghuangporus weigelae]